MVIVEREGKYFLQISNGELELSEKQAKARLEKGAQLKVGTHVPEGKIAAFAGHDDHAEEEHDPGPLSHQSDVSPFAEQDISAVEEYPPTSDIQSDVTPIAEQDEPVTEEDEVPPITENDTTTLANEDALVEEDDIVQPMTGSDITHFTEEEQPTEAASLVEKTSVWEQDAPMGPKPQAEPAPARRPAAIVTKIPTEAQAFILSDEYYDNIIREFEKVYVANDRKEKTALELLDHCQRSIDHLKLERAQPGADLALLDYQRICWLRIVVFLQALTGVPAPKHPDTVAAEKEKAHSEKELVKQLLVIQLLQETGAFPYADALKSITHDSIVGLVSRILNKDKNVIKTAMQRSGDILLRRNVSPTNAPKRLKMLIDIETYFSELPYNHVIIRLRSLKEFYKNYHDKIS